MGLIFRWVWRYQLYTIWSFFSASDFLCYTCWRTGRQCRTLSACSALSGLRCFVICGGVCTVAAVSALDFSACEDFYGDGALDTDAAGSAVFAGVICSICAAAAENLGARAYDDLGLGRCIRCGFYACCAVHASCRAVTALNRTVYNG